MKKKLLYIENVASIDAINFYLAAALAAKECNIEFHIAYNAPDRTSEKIKMLKEQYGVFFHQVDFIRKPYDIRNVKAYRQICHIIASEKISIIHCNTPIGGIIGRLAGKKCGISSVLYQAHGLHFYKGAPKLNWLLYYPVEKLLAHYTDAIIVINKEDYKFCNYNLKCGRCKKIYYVPGVGIDTKKYFPNEEGCNRKRKDMGLKDTDIALISVGELNKEKNYSLALEVIAQMNNRNIHYFICGKGPEAVHLKNLSKQLGIEGQVHFLGYRTDICELLNASDIFLFTTKREGLPRSMMEAMASGLPCVASKIRGNIDLLENSKGGILCVEQNDYVAAINKISGDTKLRKQMASENLEVIRRFDIEFVRKDITKIYCEKL